MQLEKIASHPGQADGLGFISTKEALNLNFTLTAGPEPGNADDDDGEAGTSTQHRRQQQELAGTAAQPFRPSDKERALKYFVEQGWLAKTPNQDTCYSLGPRSFLELGTMLAEMDLESGPKAA
jgi:Nse1 non-SMC component of SMC5-6 complex